MVVKSDGCEGKGMEKKRRRIFDGEGCVLDGFEKFFDRSVMGP